MVCEMAASPVSENPTVAARSWPQRLRLIVAALLIWAGLQYLLNATLMAPGLARPATLAASHHPVLAALGLAIILLVGSLVAARVAGSAYSHPGLLTAALGLALWVIPAGTMTEWLMYANPQVGPPTGAAYWPWLLNTCGCCSDGGRGGSDRDPLTALASLDAHHPRGIPPTVGLHSRAVRASMGYSRCCFHACHWRADADPDRAGDFGSDLAGPGVLRRRRGQRCGTFAACRVLRVTEPIWYCRAPILAGLIGVLVATIRPALLLPAAYAHLNSIPAWGLARPLPIEMVGVGVAVCLWALRASQRSPRTGQP